MMSDDLYIALLDDSQELLGIVEMNDQPMQSGQAQSPKISEFEHKVRELQEAEINIEEFKDYLRIEGAKQFDNGSKATLLVMRRQLDVWMNTLGMHYGKPCSDKEVGYDDSHNYHDLGDPCYCGSDNCGVCLDCGEENHD